MPCLIENPVTGNTLCRCHPCDAYESLSEQTENKTSPAIRDGQKYVEVEFDEDDAIRLSLSKEKGVRFEGDRAYLPEEGFDLSGFSTAMWKRRLLTTPP